jgi:hypothetical protein
MLEADAGARWLTRKNADQFNGLAEIMFEDVVSG